MTETFLDLSPKDRLEALGVAATTSGRPLHLLEKDVWVVWALAALFESRFTPHLVYTAIHVFCRQRRSRGERFVSHWHDLTRIDETGYAANALADRDLARAVARHKAWFFSEKDKAGTVIDYMANESLSG